MSYEEKGTWVYLVVSLGTYLGYVIIITGRMGSTPLAEVPYAATMLWAIGIAIVAAIIARILVEIAKPSDSYKIDARDKEINRFGEYVGGLVLGISMVVPLILSVMETDYFWISNAIYAAFVLAAVVGSLVKLVAYRRGL